MIYCAFHCTVSGLMSFFRFAVELLNTLPLLRENVLKPQIVSYKFADNESSQKIQGKKCGKKERSFENLKVQK